METVVDRVVDDKYGRAIEAGYGAQEADVRGMWNKFSSHIAIKPMFKSTHYISGLREIPKGRLIMVTYQLM